MHNNESTDLSPLTNSALSGCMPLAADSCMLAAALCDSCIPAAPQKAQRCGFERIRGVHVCGFETSKARSFVVFEASEACTCGNNEAYQACTSVSIEVSKAFACVVFEVSKARTFRRLRGIMRHFTAATQSPQTCTNCTTQYTMAHHLMFARYLRIEKGGGGTGWESGRGTFYTPLYTSVCCFWLRMFCAVVEWSGGTRVCAPLTVTASLLRRPRNSLTIEAVGECLHCHSMVCLCTM